MRITEDCAGSQSVSQVAIDALLPNAMSYLKATMLRRESCSVHCMSAQWAKFVRIAPCNMVD
jgi:hypothetical protein